MQQSFEVILVNDSPFFLDTVRTLKQLTENLHLITITLRKNQEKAYSSSCGIKKCTGNYIITMDDDLQHPVKEIPKLLSATKENEDLEVVFG
ncbi:MAG: glycosyltransferase [Balneolaceae bacterium]|nr:glycosyltransferase [Balneolaceae bacterium]